MEFVTCTPFSTAPADYFGFSGIALTFLPGGPSVLCARIVIIDDQITEGVETFNFLIDQMQDPGVIVGSPSSAVVSILDGGDVVIFAFEVSTLTVTEGDAPSSVCVTGSSNRTIILTATSMDITAQGIEHGV